MYKRLPLTDVLQGITSRRILSCPDVITETRVATQQQIRRDVIHYKPFSC